jgi:hypothetical protein
LLTPLFRVDKPSPFTESSVLQTSPNLAGLFGLEARPFDDQLYKKRSVQGKCEAN